MLHAHSLSVAQLMLGTVNLTFVHVFVTKYCICDPVDQNVSTEEVPVTGDDKPKFGQTIRVGGDVEGPNMDGNNQLQFPCT